MPWPNRPSSAAEYVLPLATDIDYKSWLELTRLCEKLKVSTWSTQHNEPRFDVFIREEDKDLL